MSEEKVSKPRKTAAKKAATTVKTVKAKAAPSAASAKNGAVAAVAAAAPSSVKAKPTHEQIAALAHKFYVERGCKHGFHDQDWHRAVRELS
ncbi:MAG: DUF2934 domain-containing protein [Acidobacteriaceae bacterium]|nr:DUF2934 domain-containing protein [Acidobacteriaceae bacterium]